MKVWNIYEESPGSSHGIKITRTLNAGNEDGGVSVMETEDFGRILVSGDSVRISDCGEDPYHEMMAHLPLLCSPAVRCVLLIGGSDGGSLSMMLRHPDLERITIVGMDASIHDAMIRNFPQHAAGFVDPRVRMIWKDGTEFVRDCRERFDLIIVDIPGAAFSPQYPQSFFCDCFRLLSSDGAIVTDCGSHGYMQCRRELASAVSKLKRLFPFFRLYDSPGILPCFSHRLFAFATKTFDPAGDAAIATNRMQALKARYLNADIMKAAFALPEYVRQMLEVI